MIKNRGVALSLVIVLVSTMLLPFSISANGSLPSPFVGFNCQFIDINFDEEYETDISSSGGTYSGTVARHSASVTMEGDFTAIQRTSSGVTYMTTEAVSGSVTGNNSSTGTITESSASESGTLSLTLSSNSVAHYTENALMELEIILDNDYIGYINLTVKRSSTSLFTRNVYINGSSVTVTLPIEGAYSNSDISNHSIVINSFDLTRNVGNYWQYPIESYNFVSYFFGIKEPVNYYMSSDYVYPKFPISNGDQIWRSNVGAGRKHILIFEIDKYVISSTLSNYISYPSDFSVNYTAISTNPLNDTNYGMTIKLEFTNNSNAQKSLQVNYIGADTQIMPIYSRLSTYRYLSTDFALLYGLSNDLLDSLTYGTESSNQSVSNLDDSTSELNDSISDYVGVENQFNTDMNEALEDLDLNSNLPSAMGTKFLQSANWVRVQFNRMTENTPFGSVLGFSLVVGIALLVLGKIWK